MRDEWEMEFYEGAAPALERMQACSFDAVVADMRMPGMNGAELLNEVMKRHPRTVRLILSGHADKELILQSVGSTHQFLAKPCDPEALKATVQRATSLESILGSEPLQKLVGRLTRLPSIPSLYVEIVEKANQPDTSLEDVARIVSRDMAMTAGILKLVNSAFFGLRRELASAEEAVAYIGLDTIKSLVLTIHAFSRFEHLGGATMESLWTHSLKVASICRTIGHLEEGDRKLVDEAVTAGLLHDVGKLILAVNLPAQFAEATRLATTEPMDAVEAEVRVIGADHAAVGGYLLGLWGLPVPVVEAITLHHRPTLSPPATFGPLAILHAANALAHETDPAAGDSPHRVDAPSLESIGLEDRLPVWRQALKRH
jgi:HD-like signal output (HDOD) protein